MPVHSNVTIDFRSIGTGIIVCRLAFDGSWSNPDPVVICTGTNQPGECSTHHISYQNRARFTDANTLQILQVQHDESGIYTCREPLEQKELLISGVIIVGQYIGNNGMTYTD